MVYPEAIVLSGIDNSYNVFEPIYITTAAEARDGSSI